MSPHLLLALLMAPALGHDLSPNPRPARAPVTRTLDFSALTWAEAVRLQGRRVRVVLELDSDCDHEGGYTLYECAGHDEALRTVWFAEELEGQDVQLAVEGTLKVIHHRTRGWVPDFVEYRPHGRQAREAVKGAGPGAVSLPARRPDPLTSAPAACPTT
jgi:hypothetical protein